MSDTINNEDPPTPMEVDSAEVGADTDNKCDQIQENQQKQVSENGHITPFGDTSKDSNKDLKTDTLLKSDEHGLPGQKRNCGKDNNTPNTSVNSKQTQPSHKAKSKNDDNEFPTLYSTDIKLDKLDEKYGGAFYLINVNSITSSNKIKIPYPHKYRDKWDIEHVKMPNSDHNKTNWSTINKKLNNTLTKVNMVEHVISKYNHTYGFDVLNKYLDVESNNLKLVNKIAMLALNLPNVVTQSVPLLRQRMAKTLFLSQHQIACLLANAFFCTFPRRSQLNDEYKHFPTFNFGSLFGHSNPQRNKQVLVEKLKCIFNYFDNCDKHGDNIVTIQRRYFNRQIDWGEVDCTLKGLKILPGGYDEQAYNYPVVNFANKYIGGGVLTYGSAQEELLFMQFPELIVSRLFTEGLLKEEALVITGALQYNKIKGYSSSFKYDGNYRYKQTPPLDGWGRHRTQVIAIDAPQFQSKNDPKNFEKQTIDFILNKAYCGFYDRNEYRGDKKPAVVSGKWGAGAYNGDPNLVCVLQIMAAAKAGRDLILYVANDDNLKDNLEAFHEFAVYNKWKVNDMYDIILKFKHSRCSNLYQWLYEMLSSRK